MAAFPFSGTPLANEPLVLFTQSRSVRINKFVFVNPTGSPTVGKAWLVPTGQTLAQNPHLVSPNVAIPPLSSVIVYEMALLMLPPEGGTLWAQISIGDCNVHGSASTL